MNITGIICEYDPFHNGHKYHIDMTRKICGSDYVIAVMSGNFTQRGTPAITDLYSRTKMALENGCDVVLQLPVRYSTASAEGFARGAINTLAATSIVNSICFGTECEESHPANKPVDLSHLQKAADILDDEPEDFSNMIKDLLKNGISYPAARESALKHFGLDGIEYSPNNILAIEYLRACKHTAIKPYAIKRVGSRYNDEDLSAHDYVSAAAIRKELCSKTPDHEMINKYMPEYDPKTLAHPVFTDHFSFGLSLALLTHKNQLDQFEDISDDLAKRITNHLSEYEDWESFASLIKTKQYTYTRIMRCLCHCMLGIKKHPTDTSPDISSEISSDTSPDISSEISSDTSPGLDEQDYTKITQGDRYPTPYIRVLGFRKDSSAVMKLIKDNANVPILVKSTGINLLKDHHPLAYEMFSEDIRAEETYRVTRNLIYKLHEERYTGTIII